ncbi:hypothetical protein [Kitasatospora sp. NPDC088548]|uniref:hypothetical protein n=1 Tax=Kitasatospora sp. NPDC088548 TaxID=3364075 RepID=UPI003815FEFA
MARRRPRNGRAVPAGNSTGRRSLLLSPDVEKKLLDGTRQGMPVETAAAFAGVARSTFMGWIARGRTEAARRHEGQPPQPAEDLYVTFHEQIEQAREIAHAGAVVQLRRLINGGFVVKEVTRRMRDPETGQIVEETTTDRAVPDFKSISFYLERQHRRHWGKDAQPEEATTPAADQAEHLDADELAERLAVTLHAMEYPDDQDDNSTRH